MKLRYSVGARPHFCRRSKRNLAQGLKCPRFLTLSRPDVQSATNVGVNCLLNGYIVHESHPYEAITGGTVDVFRGAGLRSCCAGGDVVFVTKDDLPDSPLAANPVR